MDLTKRAIAEALHYCPETGIFTSKVSRGATRVGNVAGTISDEGYRVLTVYGVRYKAGRVAVLLMTGEWPKGEVDHINRVKDDNRWANLRDVDASTNCLNRVRTVPHVRDRAGKFARAGYGSH